MASKQAPPERQIPLKITAAQCEALHATRLKAAIRPKIEQAGPGMVPLTLDELVLLHEEGTTAALFIDEPIKKLLVEVGNRAFGLLDATADRPSRRRGLRGRRPAKPSEVLFDADLERED